MTPREPMNARILVIDDEESVRDSFVSVLCPVRAGAAVDEAAAALFGEPEPVAETPSIRFEVDCARSGEHGFQLVQAAIANGRPYAVIFCDMRMPGWDGVQTVEHIRGIDPRAEIIFVTAYSDYPLGELIAEVGADVGYHVKPFATEEMRQLATKGVLDWNQARKLEALARTITSLRGDAGDIEQLLRHVLSQICSWLDTDSAAIAQIGADRMVFRLGVGTLSDPEVALPLLERARDASLPSADGGALVLPIWEFGVAVALRRAARITSERLYLLRVFMEHAAIAIQNGKMHAELLEAQRLSGVGQALGFIIHDLRGPVGTARQLLTMLAEGDESVLPRHEMLPVIDRLLGQTLGLVSDTLSFCRGEVRTDPRPLDLRVALDDALKIARIGVEAKGITLAVAIPAGLVAAVDPERLARVVHNLVHNAAEAVHGRPDARVQVDAMAAPGGVELRVTDNGPGIPEAVAARLFEPFATGGKAEGTGFGLAIVQQIVRAHRGRVSFDTGPHGTRFIVFLPAASADPSVAAHGEDPRASAPRALSRPSRPPARTTGSDELLRV